MKGVDTRIRKSLRVVVGSQMEFRRYRKKKMLTDRLDEIAQLKKSTNTKGIDQNNGGCFTKAPRQHPDLTTAGRQVR